MKKKLLKEYSIAIAIFALVAAVAQYGGWIFRSFETSAEHGLLLIFFVAATLFAVSSVSSHVARLSRLPSFVIAIFFGVAAKPLLLPVVENQEALSVLVGLGATLILFSGGLETPFANFKKLMAKIFSLSFVGLLATALLTSLTIFGLHRAFGWEASLITAVLLGSVLASTDPAAIIPILKRLKFTNRSIKDIVVSESAVTDVVGTLLTVVFLGLIASGTIFGSVWGWYGSVFNQESIVILGKQIFFGALLGCVGYILLEAFLRLRKKSSHGIEADLPFFLFVPIMIFVFALVFGGSGYLAAFIAGLLFYLTEHLKGTEHFFNNLVEGFFKPTIFILLGALVDVGSLLSYAPIGILAALAFMFVIRPLAVFLSLAPFRFFGKERLSWKDMLFISFVRETGAIPAVLLVTIVSLNIPGTEGLVEIGMWVILLTLIIEPPLTPKVAKYLGVATPISELERPTLPTSPAVMLVSRGRGFMHRLPVVVAWARRHTIDKVVLLLCLESKHTPELEAELQEIAFREFKKINDSLVAEGAPMIGFQFMSRDGTLEDNINLISETAEQPITIIFAGKRILDYKPNELRQLTIPVKFID